MPLPIAAGVPRGNVENHGGPGSLPDECPRTSVRSVRLAFRTQCLGCRTENGPKPTNSRDFRLARALHYGRARARSSGLRVYPPPNELAVQPCGELVVYFVVRSADRETNQAARVTSRPSCGTRRSRSPAWSRGCTRARGV